MDFQTFNLLDATFRCFDLLLWEISGYQNALRVDLKYLDSHI